jgi:hypothetical protein
MAFYKYAGVSGFSRTCLSRQRLGGSVSSGSVGSGSVAR